MALSSRVLVSRFKKLCILFLWSCFQEPWHFTVCVLCVELRTYLIKFVQGSQVQTTLCQIALVSCVSSLGIFVENIIVGFLYFLQGNMGSIYLNVVGP